MRLRIWEMDTWQLLNTLLRSFSDQPEISVLRLVRMSKLVPGKTNVGDGPYLKVDGNSLAFC